MRLKGELTDGSSVLRIDRERRRRRRRMDV
jgi:hypothetical protein